MPWCKKPSTVLGTPPGLRSFSRLTLSALIGVFQIWEIFLHQFNARTRLARKPLRSDATVREKDRVRRSAAARSDLKFGDELRGLERYAKHAVAFEAQVSQN